MNVLRDAILIARHADKLLLVNPRPVELKTFTYSTFTTSFVQKDPEGKELYHIQAAPFYFLQNIPPQSFAHLENLKGRSAEDGQAHYKLIHALWEDGQKVEEQELNPFFQDMEKLPDLPFADVPKRFLKNQRPPQGLHDWAACQDFFSQLH